MLETAPFNALLKVLCFSAEVVLQFIDSIITRTQLTTVILHHNSFCVQQL